MAKTIGCIGCGNMGSALLAGFAGKLDRNEWRLLGCDTDAAKAAALANRGVEAAKGLPELVKASDIVIFAVKPAAMPDALAAAEREMTGAKTAISIAAGMGLASLRNQLGQQCRIARCMPTTTARAGRGVFALCVDPLSQSAEFEQSLLDLFGKLGLALMLPESRFSDFAAFIGAGPAYVFQAMQGLAQAGLTLGFSQGQTRKMLVELFAGCAALAAQEPDRNFAGLRDDVCSPAGLTIAGVNVLERAGLNGILVDAALAAHKRATEMEG